MVTTYSINELPFTPGVYLFFDVHGKVIYVGKAKRLKTRVSSYFKKSTSLTPMKQVMVKIIHHIEYVVTKTENDALILEAHCIKKFSPPYNVIFKDDKDYVYIRVGIKEKWPTVTTVRRPVADGTIYLGPYPRAFAVHEALRYVRTLFPYFTKSPGKMSRTERDLLAHRSKKVIPLEYIDYRAMTSQIAGLLMKKDTKIIRSLTHLMNDAVKSEDFERAAKLRDQIVGLETVWQRTTLKLPTIPRVQKFNDDLEQLMAVLDLPRLPYRIEGYDISNIQGTLATGAMVVLENGVSAKKWYRKFRIRMNNEPNDVAMMAEVLDRRFSHFSDPKWPMPDLIMLDGGKGQLSAGRMVMEKYKLDIPMIALAKKEETIYFLDGRNPLALSKENSALHVLQLLRDEAHRFSRAYHFVRRTQQLLASKNHSV